MNRRLDHISYKSLIIPISAIIISLIILVACLRKTGNPIIDAAMHESCINLYQKGRGFNIRQQTDSALYYYYACAGKYSPQLPVSEKHAIADALNNCGYINIFEKCDYTKAFEDLLKAYGIAEESDYKEVKPYISLNIGNVYYDFSDFGTAFDYYIKSYHDAIGTSDYRLARISLINIAIIAYEHDLDTPYINELRAIKRQPAVKDPVVTDVLQAVLEAMDGKSDSAIKHIENAEKNVHLTPNPERMVYSLSKVKAKILSQTGEYAEAIKILDSINVPNNDDRMEIFAMLSENYGLNGDHKLASEYRLKFLEMKDTIQSAQKVRTIHSMKGSAEKREMAGRIADLTNKHRFSVIISVTVSIFLVITLVLLLLIYISRRKIKESHRELYLRTLATLNDTPTPVNIENQPEQNTGSDSCSDTEQGHIHEDTTPSEMPDVQMTRLAQRIQEVMETSEEIYSSDFSLTRLAHMLDTTTRAVSKSINTVYGVNYSSYLAAYRVREACRRLSDPTIYRHMTIQAISESLGFKSRSNFISHFKAQTGLTPSEYIKVAK